MHALSRCDSPAVCAEILPPWTKREDNRWMTHNDEREPPSCYWSVSESCYRFMDFRLRLQAPQFTERRPRKRRNDATRRQLSPIRIITLTTHSPVIIKNHYVCYRAYMTRRLFWGQDRMFPLLPFVFSRENFFETFFTAYSFVRKGMMKLFAEVTKWRAAMLAHIVRFFHLEKHYFAELRKANFTWRLFVEARQIYPSRIKNHDDVSR